MNTNYRIRFSVMAILAITGLLVQSAVAAPAKVDAETRPAQEAGQEGWLELSATLGEPFVPNEQPKPELLDTVTVDSRTPTLDLPPLPPDPDKQPIDSAPPERNRDYWTIPMSENFEGAFPNGLWNVFDNNGATYGEYFWDDDDFKPHLNYWSAWVANGGANGVDPQYNNYANNMDSWMMYGPFDLSGCSAADFEFYYWNKSEANYDFFGWGASPNGSNVYGWQLSGSQESWNYVDFDLAQYLGDSSVWLTFIFRSDGSNTDIGTFVDDIALWCLTETDVKSWTYMVYLAGDNNLESAAVDDFLEMSSVGSSANVNIVALMDRIPGFDTSYDDWTDTRRFYITNGMTPAAANGVSWGEANMGDPEVLLKFVRWAKAAYPANHYVLVFWDHGSGWRLRAPNDAPTKGVSFDDTSAGDSIDMPEMRNSLSILTGNGASPFDIVQLDACLMAMAEVDNQIKPYANIRVSSEESEPNDGAPYNTILSALVANPAMSATTLATNMVDFYYSSYGNNETQSAVNLGSPYATLNTAVDNLAVALMNNGHNYISGIQTARNTATQFSSTYYIDLWDFADWVRIYVPDPTINNAAVAVKSAVLAAVVHEHHGTSWPWARGISIYFPKTPGEYDARYDGGTGFLQFTANTHWDEWVHTYHNFANYPIMFNKSSPANGATGQLLSLTLSWASSAGATRYDYCIDTSNDGVCGGSWTNNGTNTSIMLGLSGGTTYYWQVRAVNASGTVYANTGTWWSFTTGNPPAAFNKSGPTNGATSQSLSPTLTWGTSTFATSYEYCYDTSNDNACSGWTSNGSSTSKALSGLSEYTTYYWHVIAINIYGVKYSDGNSPTAFWSFTTGGVPGSFNKSNPSNGATNRPLNLTLIWGTSSNVASYDYCYDTDDNNSCDSSWINTGTNTSASISGLGLGTTYYWHVRANNSFGSSYSDSAAWWSFTTGNVPGAFYKTTPVNGATNRPLSLTLIWGNISNVASYDYCYDTNDNNSCDSSWINTGTKTSAPISGLGLGTTYYWQVRANNSFGSSYSDSAAWWSFTTGNVPGAFNKTSPADGAGNRLLSPTLSWGSSNNASNYQYCYDMSNNNSCDGSWINNGTSTSAHISGLSLGTTYYWHVRANNSFGTSYSDSDTWWSFTTGNVPGAFNKISPVNGAKNRPTTLTLHWGPSSGAASYSYCYDTNNNNTCDGSWVNTGASTSAPISGLGLGKTYYWQVKAFNSFGKMDADGGVWWNFTTPLQAIFKSVAAQDGWILESTETSNVGGTLNTSAVTFNLGDNAQNKQYRGILSFGTGASLPDNAVVTKVTLKVKKSAIIGGGNPVSMFQGFMVDIKKGTFGMAALEINDFQTLASITYGPFMTPLSDGWYTIDLTTGKAYINKLSTLSGLTQIRLRFKLDDNINAIANYLNLFSGDADEANHPQLIIIYYIP